MNNLIVIDDVYIVGMWYVIVNEYIVFYEVVIVMLYSECVFGFEEYIVFEYIFIWFDRNDFYFFIGMFEVVVFY